MTSIRVDISVQRDDFTLEVNTDIALSGVTAIFGSSGSGKTTLLRCIAGLIPHTQGCITLGETIWQNETEFIATHKRGVGFVFQQPSLFAHLNVQKNINFGLYRAKAPMPTKQIKHMLDLMGIESLLNRMPWQLSGGEQQRVAIARTLVTNPNLLLLDEPLAALGDDQKSDILPFLTQTFKQLSIPVVYVSHVKDEIAKLADHLVLLESGKIIGQGEVKEMFTSLDLPLAHALDAESVIETEVTDYDENFGLVRLNLAGISLQVASPPLTLGSHVRLQIFARDISIALEKPNNSSILNVIPVIIDSLKQQGKSQVNLRLLVGNSVILSRITRKSALQLNLKPGDSVYAQIKTAAICV